MASLLLTKLICTFSIFWLIVKAEDDIQSVWMRGVQCNASEKFIYKNYSCYAKSYSRNISTTHFIATTKVPLNNLRVSFHAQFGSLPFIWREMCCFHGYQLFWNTIRPISDFSTNTEPFTGMCWTARTSTSALWLKKKETTSYCINCSHWLTTMLLDCSIVALIMWVGDEFRSFYFQFFQGINLRNGTAKVGKLISIWASGDYKYIINLFEGNETVASVNVIITILSPDKNSFG